MNTSSNAHAPAGPNRVRTFLNGFVLGVILTGAVGWYVVQQGKRHPEAQERFHQATDNTVDLAAESIQQAGEAFSAKLQTLELQPDQVREELVRTGKVVRRRARELAGTVADAASDARTTAVVSAKIAKDDELSVWKISVSTQEGHVTLDGTVASPEEVAKAVALAVETDDVREVTANLKVKPPE